MFLWKMSKVVKFWWLNRGLHENKSLLDKIVRLQTMLDEFCQRKGNNIFYGGERPDSVDFRCYAVVRRVRHTFMMKQFLD